MAKEILLLGEFSTGKSAFINMLLGVSILPERLESTDLPIVKIHGQKPTGIFLREKGQKNPAILDNWNDIPVDWTLFDYAEMTIPNHELLSKGLVIWDTPGFNSINPHHVHHLDNFLLRGHHNFEHVLFFVRNNISKTSLDMLKKYNFNNDRVIVVVNIHFKSSPEDNNRMFSNVQKILNDNGFHYRSILLSIGDVCEEFNDLADSALKGEQLSDWDLIKQWDKRKVDTDALLNEFSSGVTGKELFTLISEFAQSYEKNEDFYKGLPIPVLKDYADAGDPIAQDVYSTYQFLNLYFAESIKYLRLSAENGYGPAQHQLALFYKEGYINEINRDVYVGKDESYYHRYLHLAMRNNVIEAIAESYFEGVGCEKNPQTGFSILLSAWKNGDTKVLEKIASCYEEGNGVEKNPEQAEKFYRLAVNLDPDISVILGSFLIAQKDTNKRNEGILLLQKFASRSFLAELALFQTFLQDDFPTESKKSFERLSNTQRSDGLLPYLLAKYHLSGIGTAQNREKGFEYLKKAYSIDGTGFILLAECYDNGVGCTKNRLEAIKIFRNNALKGCTYSKWKLGTLLLEDEDTINEGYNLIKEAAEEGEPDAISMMVELHKEEKPEISLQWLAKMNYEDKCEINALYGEVYFVNHSFNEAIKYFQKAVYQGDIESGTFLGICAFNGLGMVKNERQAFQYFESAAKNGSPDAMAFLGLMYFQGDGVEKDMNLSNIWYLKAAETGNQDAMRVMGIRYLQGKDIKKNEAKAFELLNKLAELNDPEACAWLGAMYNRGIYVDCDQLLAKHYLEQAVDGGMKESIDLLAEVNSILNTGPYARWRRTANNGYYFEINGESVANKTEYINISDTSIIIYFPNTDSYFYCHDFSDMPVDRWYDAEFLGTDQIVFFRKERAKGDSFVHWLVDFKHPIDWNSAKKYWIGDDYIIQTGFHSYVIFDHSSLDYNKIYPISRFKIKWKKDKNNSFYLKLNGEYLSGGRITESFRQENNLICVISDLKYKINLLNFVNANVDKWYPAIFTTTEKGFLQELTDLFFS